MKKLLLGLFALGMIVADIPTAEAVVCARGVVRAGCAGPRGAVVTTRRPVVVAPRVGVRCVWRAGVRVCR